MSKNFRCAICGAIVSEKEVYHIMGEPVPTCPVCHETDMLFSVTLFAECCDCGYYSAVDSLVDGDCCCHSCGCSNTLITINLAYPRRNPCVKALKKLEEKWF